MKSLRRLFSACLSVLLCCAFLCAAAAETYEPIIAAGGSFMYARDTLGKVYCWGDNQFGQLGRGNKAQNKNKLYEFQSKNKDLDISKIRGIFCGCDYSYFLMKDGSIYGVGTGSNGQNLDQKGNRNTHVRLSYKDKTIVTIATGYGHTLVLNKAGEVRAWGRNHYGQVGNGNKKGPVREAVRLKLPKITDIACGGFHSAAVDEKGNLWLWGHNEYHQISPAKDKYFDTPQKIDLGGIKVKNVELGGHFTAVVDEDGTLYMWGRNDAKQVSIDSGRAKYVDKVTKVDLPLPVKDIACYGSHTWCILEDGSVWSWGCDGYGELGYGFRTPADTGLALSHGELEYKGKPYSSKILESGAVAVTTGDLFGCIMLEDGTLLSAGMNKFGQLGRTAPYNGDAALGKVGVDLIPEK